MTRLGTIFLEKGHIYISKLGYISIVVYLSDVVICDYVARMIGGTTKPHKSIYKVIITNRNGLKAACKKLLVVVNDYEAEDKLRLVLEYATEFTKEERDKTVFELRKLLKENTL